MKKKGSKLDIDYLTTYNEKLILVECKDFKQGVQTKDLKDALKQLSELIEIAKQVQSPVVIFSTLLPVNNPTFKNLVIEITKLNLKNKAVVVHLLSLEKMGFINLSDPNNEIVKRIYLLRPTS